MRKPTLGEDNGHWKGGRTRSQKGYEYIRMPEHPRATNNGYVKRADLVMETILGRILCPGEIVHHKNGVKDDDSPDNLEVLTGSEHGRLHAEERATRTAEARAQRRAEKEAAREARKAVRVAAHASRRVAQRSAKCAVGVDTPEREDPIERIQWPSDAVLRDMVVRTSYRKVARLLGCSHVAIFWRLNPEKGSWHRRKNTAP